MSAVALPSVSTTIRVPPGAAWDGRWLVCFGEDWGRHNSTAQYLALALAADRGASLVWVDSLGLREPRLNRTDAIRVVRRLGRWLRVGPHAGQDAAQGPGPAHASDIDLHVISPLALPFLRFRAVRRFNRIWVEHQLGRLRRRIGITAPLVITACPATVDVLDCLDPVCRVYYCADEHASLPDMNPQLVRALEAELLDRVDLVFASSRALVASKAALHPAVTYLPHGVDVDHFARALDPGLSSAVELRDLPCPIVGYVGLIGRHLDLASIVATAGALTGGSVVLIGPVEEGLDTLPRAPNLHYMGPRPHAELPAWLAAFDVALLPWNEGERNRFAHPAKVREYLAAGCPVVARDHPELAEFGSAVTCTASPVEFAAAVAARAGEPVSAEQRAGIAAAVSEHDWSARASTVSTAVTTFAAPPMALAGGFTERPAPGCRQPPVAFRHRFADVGRAAWQRAPAVGDQSEWAFADARGALLCLLGCLAAARPGIQRVIVPAWTCWSVAAAVEYAGLEPVCCDVDPVALDFDADDLVRCLREPALAVIATHLLGAPPDLSRLGGHPHAGCIIEDAAQASDPQAEPLSGAAVRIVSAARGKPLAAGGGGWLRVVDPDSVLARDLDRTWHRLPDPGRTPALRTALAAAVGNLCLHPRAFALVVAIPALEVGVTRYPARIEPARADSAQRVLWRAGASRLASIRAGRRRAAADYAAAIAQQISARQPAITFRSDYAPYRFPAFLDRPLTEIEPRHLAAAARAGVVPMYPRTLVSLEPRRPWSPPADMPGASWIVRHLVTLPTHEGIGAHERRMALAALHQLNGGNGNGRGR